MSSVPRALLIAGALAASVSLAKAGHNDPTPVAAAAPETGPATMEAAPAIVAAASATAGERRRAAKMERRGRRGKLARSVRGAEVAAAQPTPGLAAAASGVRLAANPAAEVRGTIAPGQEPAAKTPEGGKTSEVASADSPRERGAPTLSDLVARHAQENGVPVGLGQAVVRIESRGNPRAAHGGALGLMQIKPGTARAVGFSGSAAALFIAETNLHYGMKILGEAYRSAGGDVCRALMQYQSGHLATRMSRANRAYCSKARAIMAGA